MVPYYEQGGVTLYCGDCREVLPSLPSGLVDLVLTDPPYGARRPSARRTAEQRFEEVAGNATVDGSWLADAYRVTKDGGALYTFACWDVLGQWLSLLRQVGYRVRSCIVWDKGVHGLADLETCWAPQHEMILFGAKGRHVLRGSRPKDVIRAERLPAADLLHPYQKPTAAITPMLLASTEEGMTVLDPFAGSGTALLAARDCGCRAIGIEVDEGYCRVAVDRLSQGVLFSWTPATP